MPLVIPTILDEEQVREFQGLYKKHYGIDLSVEEAQEKGVHLLRFMTVVIENYDTFFDEEL